jgi:sugar lactone lactonase YvrE
MHVAPILHRLPDRFAGEPVVVLGVHTGKFDHEQEPEAVRAAMDRMGIRHPVLVDQDMRTWHAFGVGSWPTLVVVRPEGTIAAVAPGEPDEAALSALVKGELERARSRGLLAREPHSFLREGPSATQGLRFPTKLATSNGGLLAVSDTGHGRVLVWGAGGALVAWVGPQAEAPAGIEADLEEPQGLTFVGEHELFVCDARRHTVVRVDLETRTAEVVAGTGSIGLAPLPFDGSVATGTALRSPWDIAATEEALYVALSGSHQIGVVDRRRRTIRALAGTSAESRIDGPGREATFSQTNGLVQVGAHLYAADSESSSLRVVHTSTGETATLVYGSLFAWGDRDGAFPDAQLQHPMGLAYDGNGTLAVCDSYNGAVKLASLEAKELRTVVRGLSVVSGAAFLGPERTLLVADTNHHRILRVGTGGDATPLTLEVPAPPPPRRHRGRPIDVPAGAVRFFDEVLSSDQALGPGHATIDVVLHAGDTHHFAEGAPYTLALEVSRRSDLVVPAFTSLRGTLAAGALELTLPLAIEVPAEAPIASELVLHVRAMACREGDVARDAVCEPFTGWWRVPLRLERSGASRARASAAG